MLVGFSGPSGSGKTTLVNRLYEILVDEGYNVGVVEEVARKVFARYKDKYGFESLKDLRKSDKLLNFQFDILVEQIKSEDQAMEKHDIVLSDRTIYDNLFFTIPSVYNCDYGLLDKYLSIFIERDLAEAYDLIFFCDPVDGDVDDRFRTQDINYRRFQGYIMWKLLPYFLKVQKKVQILPNLPVEDRVEICLNYLKRLAR